MKIEFLRFTIFTSNLLFFSYYSPFLFNFCWITSFCWNLTEILFVLLTAQPTSSTCRERLNGLLNDRCKLEHEVNEIVALSIISSQIYSLPLYVQDNSFRSHPLKNLRNISKLSENASLFSERAFQLSKFRIISLSFSS